MAPKELNFITGNKNKLLEVQTILAGVVELKSQALDLIEVQGTIEDVTLDKCKRAAEMVCTGIATTEAVVMLTSPLGWRACPR